MNNYGYRGIPTVVPAIAGRIERGSVARRQRKGDKFVISRPGGVNILINRTDGVETHITVLDKDGRALALLAPNAII